MGSGHKTGHSSGAFQGSPWTWEADRLCASSLQLPEVRDPSLSDLLPTFPSKLDGGGIFFLRRNSEGLALCFLAVSCTTSSQPTTGETRSSLSGSEIFSQNTRRNQFPLILL